MSREDQFSVSAVMAYEGATRDLGVFDKFDGGEVDSEESKFHPGGMAEQISLGGRVEVGNVTVSRLYDLARDHSDVGWVLRGAGKALVTVTKTSLDVDGNVYGRPLVYRGTLKTVTPPSHDSESSDPAMIEIEISSATVSQ